MSEGGRATIADLMDLLYEYGGRKVLYHESGTPWTFASERGEMQEAVNRYLSSQEDSPDQKSAAKDLGAWVERMLLKGPMKGSKEVAYLAERIDYRKERGPTKQSEVVGKVMEYIWERRESEITTRAIQGELPHIGKSTIRDVLAEIKRRKILDIDDRE